MKTVLLTILTLSVLVIAIVELSGISRNTFINRCELWANKNPPHDENDERLKEAKDMRPTQIEFKDTSRYNFGTIEEGSVVKHAFHFKNLGPNNLLIAYVETSCGCTSPSFPKEPIRPGEEGDIVVQFNSANRIGHQEKNILVHSNAQQESISIGFSADVTE